MFKFIKTSLKNYFLKRMIAEFTEVSDALKKSSDLEVSLIVVSVMSTKIMIQRDFNCNLDLLEQELTKEPLLSYHLNKLFQQFQKDNELRLAEGVLIWVHSVRAIQCPELRGYGVELWQELERGFKIATKANMTDLYPELVIEIPHDLAKTTEATFRCDK